MNAETTNSNTSKEAPAAEAVTEKIPQEVIDKLTTFNDALTKLEDVLKPHLDADYEQHLQREPMEMARIDLMSLFAANSLCWSLLALRGQDPRKNDNLRSELDRCRDYVSRLKVQEERRQREGLNQRVAKAVVRNALFDADEYTAAKKKRLDDGEDE